MYNACRYQPWLAGRPGKANLSPNASDAESDAGQAASPGKPAHAHACLASGDWGYCSMVSFTSTSAILNVTTHCPSSLITAMTM